MNVVVTGGAGFLGRRLVEELLARGEIPRPGGGPSITEIRVADVAIAPGSLPDDPRVRAVPGDIGAEGGAASLVDANTALVYHLAAVVSGQAEKDFDVGVRVNLDGTRSLLDACRAAGSCPGFVFASSIAVYGGDLPDVVTDETALTPQSSYGTQKAIGELLVGDYARKGFVDGRAVRLPTVVIRPGKPNAAASSFASGILREPLLGEPAVCPVAEDAALWVISPRKVVDNLLRTPEVAADLWGPNRALKLPGMTVTVAQMLAGLREVAGDRVADRVTFRPDPFIEGIVLGWPARFDLKRAPALGFAADHDIRDVIEAFIEDELGGRRPA